MGNWRKTIFPLVFSLVLASYTTYAALDTFVIEQVEGDVSFDSGLFDDITSSKEEKTSSSEQITSSSDEQPASSGEQPSSSSEVSSSSSSEEEPIEEPGPWTEDPVLTDNSYTDDKMAITINSEYVEVLNKDKETVQTKVYYADIRLKSVAYLKTCMAKDKYGLKVTEKTSTMARRMDAIFAFNGDYYGAQERGYVLRNGTSFRDKAKASDKDKGDLAIYTDGSFEYFKEKEYTLKEIQEKKTADGIRAYQVFSFGPQLVGNGERLVGENDEVAVYSKLGNQRCSLGVIGKLHYFVAICDGRLSDSWGMDLYQMADFMISKGCKSAYNLDGGGSATFYWNGEVLNRPNTNGDDDIGERAISDCVYLAA